MNLLEIRKEFIGVLQVVRGTGVYYVADNRDFPLQIDFTTDNDYTIVCYQKNYPANWEISYPVIGIDGEIDYDCIPSLSHLEVIEWIEGNL